MSVFRGCAWLMLGMGLLLPVATHGAPAVAQKLHKMIVYPAEGETVAQLKARGITRVDDYGTYWVVEVDGEQAKTVEKIHGNRAEKADYLNRIDLQALSIDSTAGEPVVPDQLRQQAVAGNRLRLVQFKGPVLPEWLAKLRSVPGVRVINYIPSNAYLVSLDEGAESAVEALRTPNGPIQWIGDYHPYYKLKKQLRAVTGSEVSVRVGVVGGPQAERTLKAIERFQLNAPYRSYTLGNQQILTLTVRTGDLEAIAQLPDVLWIEPVVPKRVMDEKQDLIAGSFTNGPGNGPVSPISMAEPLGRYVHFLTNTLGFSTSAADYPVVDVADTGLDIGSLDPMNPVFYEFGADIDLAVPRNPSRIVYLLDLVVHPGITAPCNVPCPAVPPCTCTSVGPYDCFGHGTLVSSIVVGYDDHTNAVRECVTRRTVQVCFGYQIFCRADGGPVVTNICIPTVPNSTCFSLLFTNCPSGSFTNVILCGNDVFLDTNILVETRRDLLGFQLGLGVSPFGRLGLTKVFSDELGRADGNQFFTCNGRGLADLMLNEFLQTARIVNNSWGDTLVFGTGGNAGLYTADSQTYDTLVRDAVNTGHISSTNTPGPSPLNQEMTAVFAGGNGNGVDPTAFADIVVTAPATAKNVISVGATENVRPNDGCTSVGSQSDNAQDMSFFSSFGPCEDGRFKPEIVAAGSSIFGAEDQFIVSQAQCADPFTPYDPRFDHTVITSLFTCGSGTSFSAPAVSGAVQLFWWWYRNPLGNTNAPSPAMSKAYLCNSARYVTGLGAYDDLPSNAQGMGALDLARMFDGTPRVLRDQAPFFSFLEIPPGPTNYTPQLFSKVGQTYELNGQVSDSTKPFRVSLAWTDAPGSPSAFYQLVNDLDLLVAVGGVQYKGNVFVRDHSVAGGSRDSLNNMESVFLPAGQTGTWQVVVRAVQIAGDGVPNKGSGTDQDFALVVYNGINPSDTPNVITNDSCSTAIDINSLPFSATLTLNPTVFHNTHISPSIARGGVNAFWRIPRPTQGTGFTINTSGATFPVLLSVWQAEAGAGFGVRRAECGSLVEVTANNGTGSSLNAQVNFIADGTNAYYIVVEGVNGKTGKFTLNVNATLPPITLTPTGLDFGEWLVGQTSTSQVVLLKNGSLESIDIDSVQIAGSNSSDFTISSDLCTGAVLPPGGGCLISVQFSPTAVGLRTAQLQVFDTATGSPHTIPLTGIGLTPVPVTCISTAGSLTFADTAIGTTSAAQTISITNCGVADLVITNAVTTGSAAGDYIITDACSSPILAGDVCDVSVQFRPTAAGVRAAKLQINSNATNSPAFVLLSGFASVPAPQVCITSGTSVDFGNVPLDTLSDAHSVVISNCGTAPLLITNVSLSPASGPFQITSDGCNGQTIQIGRTCTITVKFAPTDIGPATATLSITDTATGSPHTVTLTGNGTGSQPDALISRRRRPSSFIGGNVINTTGDFQTIAVNARRRSRQVFYVRVQNAGNFPDSFTVSGTGDVLCPDSGTTNGVQVAYFLGAVRSEAADITAAVKAGTFRTATLAPGAVTGDATLIRVEMKVDRNAPPCFYPALLTFISVADGDKRDAVKAEVTVK